MKKKSSLKTSFEWLFAKKNEYLRRWTTWRLLLIMRRIMRLLVAPSALLSVLISADIARRRRTALIVISKIRVIQLVHCGVTLIPSQIANTKKEEDGDPILSRGIRSTRCGFLYSIFCQLFFKRCVIFRPLIRLKKQMTQGL